MLQFVSWKILYWKDLFTEHLSWCLVPTGHWVHVINNLQIKGALPHKGNLPEPITALRRSSVAAAERAAASLAAQRTSQCRSSGPAVPTTAGVPSRLSVGTVICPALIVAHRDFPKSSLTVIKTFSFKFRILCISNVCFGAAVLC